MLMPERQCRTCRRQAEWGCDARRVAGPDGEPHWRDGAALPLEIDGETVWRCPRRPIKDDPAGWERLLLHHALFQKGFLPDDGGVLDQSAKGIEMLRLVEIVTQECLQEEAERQRRRDARGRG